MQDPLSIGVLGPIEVVAGESGRLNVGGPQQRRLVAVLATASGPVSTDGLIDALWEDQDPPADPRRTVGVYVSRLRRTVGDAVVRDGAGYRLSNATIDANLFLQRAKPTSGLNDPGITIDQLQSALELWRGPALSEFSHEMWARPFVREMDEVRVDAEDQLTEVFLAEGRNSEAIRTAERAIDADPLREQPHRTLMLALHRSGRQAEALRAFQTYRSLLGDELGLEPSSTLVELEARIATGDRSLKAPQPTTRLRDYELRRELGRGAFAIVYEGSQLSVGRDVAVKQIRAELANRPEFIRRFHAEANLVARLEHLHIVPLYDYWREPDSAFLVMRLLRGGSLDAALQAGPWDLKRTLQMVSQIGAALSVAHRAGVVHRDVKPANILLDEDGNAYLTDFGIALEASEIDDPDATLSTGTPVYASPEQLRREPVGPPADVHGLAIAAFQTLTGRLPFPDETTRTGLLQRQLNDPIPPVSEGRADIPHLVDEVMARATAKDPAHRYGSTSEFVSAFAEAADQRQAPVRWGLGTVSSESRNPYKGLLAFDEADSDDFRGRAGLIHQLVEALGSHRLVAVVGPSGSGKSSVVRAGLLPALRTGAVAGSNEWFITKLLPGPNPFEELETALLRIASERPTDLLSVLSDGERGIARGVRHAIPDENGRVLLVIDQFEELFTLADPAETNRFLDALAVAITEERSRLRVVLTLRADFYDRPLRHGAIGPLVDRATVAVLPLTPEELEQSIVEPANSVGATFEPGLVSQIVADVTGQPGVLPLLQYALTELYERNVSGLLTAQAYSQLGGVTGALTRRADDLYQGAPAEQQAIVRSVFGRLVTVGDGPVYTRRPAARSEFGTDPGVGETLDRFGSARLLAFDRDPISRQPTIEVSHEALITAWPRLNKWLDEDREALRTQQHLRSSATAWLEANRDDSELYRGGRLETALDWADGRSDQMNPLEAEFLNASEAARLAQRDREHRRLRRLRTLLAAAAVMAGIAVIAGAAAFQQARVADDRAAAEATARFDAETATLRSEAARVVESDLTVGLLLAAEAYRREPSVAGLGALQRVLTGTGNYLGTLGAGNDYSGLAITDVGGLVAARGGDHLDIFDPQTGSLLHQIDVGEQPVAGVTAHDRAVAGTDWVVTTSTDDARIIDAESGELVARFEHAVPVGSVEVDPDRQLLATGDVIGRLRLWDIRTGRLLGEVEAHPEATVGDEVMPEGVAQNISFAQFPNFGITSMAFLPDGSLASTALGSIVRSWTVPDLEPVNVGYATAPGLDGQTVTQTIGSAIRLSEDGTQFWTTDTGGLGVFDTATGHQVDYVRIEGLGGETTTSLRGFETIGDGRAVAVNEAGIVTTFDLATGRELGAIDAQMITETPGLAASSSTVVLAGDSGVRLWSLDGRQLLARSVPRGETGWFSITDGADRILASPLGIPGPVSVWDVHETGANEVANEFGPTLAGLSGGGSYFFTFGPERFLQLHETDTLQPVGRPIERPRGFTGIVVDHDRRWVALGSFSTAELDVFDITTGDIIFTSQLVDVGPTPDLSVISMALSPDGAVLAVKVADHDAQFFDTSTWQPIDVDSSLGADFFSYSPDGRFLAGVDSSGLVTSRDPTTLEILGDPFAAGTEGRRQQNPGMWWSADGQRLLTTTDGAPRLFDVDTRQQIGDPFPNDAPLVASGANGTPKLVTAVGDHILIWDLDSDGWFDIACRAAGRNLNPIEWAQFGPRGEPYQITCPQWPALG